MITAFPSVSLPFLAVPLRSQRTVAISRTRTRNTLVRFYASPSQKVVPGSLCLGLSTQHVALDMISYSSYDTQTDPVKLAKALAFIAAHHNKTTAAPAGPGAAVFVAEYGLAQNEVSNATLLQTITTVVDTALGALSGTALLDTSSPPVYCLLTGVPALRPGEHTGFGCPYVMFWETFDNECTGEVAGCSAGRCHDPAHPVTDPQHLHGFWLLRPDGSKSPAYDYLQGKIAGGGRQPL
eukprot:SAG22_NODE_1008_length_6054_cov_11.023678_11_plen_238_part_00